MRNSVSLPQNRITQGTIFCGVKSPYPHLEYCHGICITARCDTARDFKAPSLTFLPVVPMNCWLWAEALPKAIADQKKAAIGALRSHLIQRIGAATVLDAFGVAEAFDAADKNDKGIQKQRAFYDEAIVAENLGSYQWKQVPESISKKVAAEGGYFFLERFRTSISLMMLRPLMAPMSRSQVVGSSSIFEIFEQ